MKIRFDEIYASNNGERSSRNIWYEDAPFSADGEYGKVIQLNEDVMVKLSNIIENDLSGVNTHPPTETNWYFYGDTVTKDAMGDGIRPSIMVREKSGKFITHFNMSDHDFAINIDAILLFIDGLKLKKKNVDELYEVFSSVIDIDIQKLLKSITVERMETVRRENPLILTKFDEDGEVVGYQRLSPFEDDED